jgi:hypothetical protein
MPQLAENSRQGFSTKYPAWTPGPNACNSTVVIGLRAGLVLEGVRKTYRARYYNPTTGRFLSEDPIGFAGGINKYAYAGDSPTNFNDPLGLYSGSYGPQVDPGTPHFGSNFGCNDQGCFFYYGNYGGPGWTGGQWAPLQWEDFGDPFAPGIPSGLALPIDAQDGCYADHDRCYAIARVRNNNASYSKCKHDKTPAQNADERSCDGALMQCLAGVNSSRGPGNNIFSHIGQPVFSLKELF